MDQLLDDEEGLDSMLDKIKQFFEKIAAKYRATKLDVNILHENLPTADFYEQASSRTSRALVRDTAVVSKLCQTSEYVDIVEVGIRSDGVFVWVELKEDDDDAAVLDVGYELVWHPETSGREDGRKLERMLQGRTPAGSRLMSLTLKQGEDVYVVQNPGQENVHVSGNSPGFRTIRSKPMFMSKQLRSEAEREGNDSAVIPFYRFTVQLKVLETLSAAAAAVLVSISSSTDGISLHTSKCRRLLQSAQ